MKRDKYLKEYKVHCRYNPCHSFAGAMVFKTYNPKLVTCKACRKQMVKP